MEYLHCDAGHGRNSYGKSRVFFCCHPLDFDAYYSEIAADIRKSHNVVMYYPEKDATAPEIELEQMQLFVVPVTSLFLFTSNHAREVELAYAMKQHIPVLFLMQEEGLEGDFNRICGDLQFLDKHNSDTTAIPYEEKLKKYLESVFASDEMTKKIRNAFDAYVFLSYRKKDRAYAQQLMKLIHQDDFCRDVAIWYDEFLMPGENFNDAIADAIQKSTLFALVVTPNLLEQDNYVMRIEYPYAQKAGKPILPAEMLPTNHIELSHNYKNIPEPVSGKDASDIHDAFLRQVHEIAIAENDNDSQHLFFIGLAYLSGIDVEVDRVRAVRLITTSAEMNFPEAMEKLVSMYSTGEGVERDYYTAIEWQKRLIALRKQDFEADRNQKNCTLYINALMYLADYQTDASAWSDAKETNETLLALIQECKRKKYLYFSRYDLFRTILNLGTDAEMMGKPAEAELWYHRNLAIAEAWYAEMHTIHSIESLRDSYIKLGDIASRMKDKLEEAEQWYLKSLVIAEELTKKDYSIFSRRGLAVNYNRFGYLAKRMGKLEEAEQWYHKELAIAEALEAEMPTAEHCYDLCLCYSNLGNIAKQQNRLEEAEQWYHKALTIAETLDTKIQTVKSHRKLYVCYNDFGAIAKKKGKFEEAEQWYHKALAIAEAMDTEIQTVQSRYKLGECYCNLGIIADKKGKLEEGEQWYRKNLLIWETLAEETQTIELRHKLSIGYYNMGYLTQKMGKLEEAEQWYRKNLSICEALSEETQTIKSRRNLGMSYYYLGNLAKEMGKLEEAEQWIYKNLSIQEKIVAETETTETQRALGICYDNLGIITKSMGKLEEAEQWYHKSLLIAEQLEEETHTIQSRHDLSYDYYRLGSLAETMGKLEEAEQWYHKALAITETLEVETHALRFRRDLVNGYNIFGGLSKKLNKLEEAEQWYCKAQKIKESLKAEG